MSMVETLVVMAIVAVLLTFGIGAFVVFRRGVQFQAASFEFSSTVKTIQNLARNSVVSRSLNYDPSAASNPFVLQIDGYYLHFEADDFEVYSCKLIANQYDCTTREPFNNFNGKEIELHAGCGGVLIKSLTGDMVIVTVYDASKVFDTSELSNDGQCDAVLVHTKDATRSLTYRFDAERDSFQTD